MKQIVPARHLPTIAAAVIMAAMFVFGGLRFDNFATPGAVSGLLGEYAFVGIAAVGATFVILSGGIDLSVGAMVAFTSILVARLVDSGVHPLAAGGISVAVGALYGLGMGAIIQVFAVPAFMVTLAGMFAMRALAFLVHPQSLGIDHAFYAWANRECELTLWEGVAIPLRTWIFLAVLGAGTVLARWTAWGRSVYAIGGNERAARMLGLPVAQTRIGVYAFAGVCSALAGCVVTLYKQSGDPASGVGLELDVIAAVVIGGTLLSGGVGSVPGTLIGVLILGLIDSLIFTTGTLNAAWTRVIVGALLLIFIALQRGAEALGVRAAGREG